MNLTIETFIGKKYAIYLPKKIVKFLNLKEGDKVILKIIDSKIVIEPIYDPIWLAIYGKKFAKISPEEGERISLEEQRKYIENIA
ncbi:MAG: AbrB/MazE/SpoVT family DNA-binding domain-containing protein [Thermoprotei archaeon]|nr:MAG: AbrB/MazE/SpoVT family DNA-binding domain-containing protein [Thermoprotei archaeon]